MRNGVWTMDDHEEIHDFGLITASTLLRNLTVLGGTPPQRIMLAAGWAHTVALMHECSVWAWGRNDYGQLGDGSAWKATPFQALFNADPHYKSNLLEGIFDLTLLTFAVGVEDRFIFVANCCFSLGLIVKKNKMTIG